LKKKMAFNQFLYQAHQLSVLVGYTLWISDYTCMVWQNW
jgi:hypothetical protein